MRALHLVSSRVFPDKEKMVEEALEVAKGIAEKSPIAVQGTKTNLIYARDHSVPEGLEYTVSKHLGVGKGTNLHPFTEVIKQQIMSSATKINKFGSMLLHTNLHIHV